MNIIRFFFVVCFFISCSRKQNNSELLDYINSISKVDTIYTFEIDEFKNIVDTLSVQLVKKNNKGFKIYEEIISHADDDFYTIKNYFGEDNKIFYTEKSTKLLGKLSILELFGNRDDIINEGIQIFYDDNKPYDTLHLKYNYVYKNNIVKVIEVGYIDNEKKLLGKLKTIYNDEEKPLNEYFIELNDTLKSTDYTYFSDAVHETRTFDKKNNITILQKYKFDGKYENLVSKRILKENKIIIEEFSETNTNGDILLMRRKYLK